jgi:isocitrate dehydrogenase
MAKYLKLNPPKRGSKITVAKNGQLQVPDDPIVPFIQGDGIGPETWKAVQRVFELSVEQCYGNAKRLEWLEVHAGERGNQLYGPNNWLPEDTIRAIQEYKVCIKGPLTTPVGSPKTLDSTLRERLDLFARVVPVRHLEGVPSPLVSPQGMEVMIFREHTEDVYSEIEWKKGSPEAKQVINFINNEMGKKGDSAIRPDSSVGIKPISATATKRVIRLALEYAIKHKRRSCTFVHKGNVMRLTEGSFRDWGYELAKKEFGDYIVTEQEVLENHKGEAPRGRLLVRDRLADQVFQQILLRPDDNDVIATTNMNGDYLTSLVLAMAGDPGIAPVAYVGAKAAIFQAAQSATRSENGDDVNPSSVLLAGVMLFEHLGWKDSAELVQAALMRTIADGTVTYDLARKVEGAKLLRAPEFCDRIVENFEEVRKSRVRQAMERAAIRV